MKIKNSSLTRVDVFTELDGLIRYLEIAKLRFLPGRHFRFVVVLQPREGLVVVTDFRYYDSVANDIATGVRKYWQQY